MGSSMSRVAPPRTSPRTDIRDREAMNKIWSAWLPPAGAPARACVQAHMADARHLVEIMVTACK